jgi:hypothetical protein
MSGRYLGEIVHGNRLMFNRGHPIQIDELWRIWQLRQRRKPRKDWKNRRL